MSDLMVGRSGTMSGGGADYEGDRFVDVTDGYFLGLETKFYIFISFLEEVLFIQPFSCTPSTQPLLMGT